MARRLIIDGYNLLLSTPRYSAAADADLDSARERLIADLGARAADGQQVTVVFDGAGNPFSDGEPHQVGGVSVIFSAAGSDADSVIEALAAAAREAGEEAEVVTSDGATRWTSLGGPVVVTRASAFARELVDDEAAWHAHGKRKAKGHATVSDNLGAELRVRLDRMAGRRTPPA
jgi:predicted RNA-binding protein with PIN domain